MTHDQTADHAGDANRPKIFRPGDGPTSSPAAAADPATTVIAPGAEFRRPAYGPGTTYRGPASSYPAQTQVTPDVDHPPPPLNSAAGQSLAVQWLVDPANRKTVIGGGALVLAALIILSGSGVTQLVGVVMAVAVWAVFFRVAHTEKATFCIWTRLDAEEIAGLAAHECLNLSGPLSKVALHEGSVDRLDFVVTGTLSAPLEFHADMIRHTDGRTCVTTSIDSWTRNRVTVWFIPVPFSKTIDGFGLYKKFGDRWVERVRQYDGDASGEYVKNPT